MNLNAERQKLSDIISDHAYGFIRRVKDHSSLEQLEGGDYLDVTAVLNDKNVSRRLLRLVQLDAERIFRKTPFDVIVTCSDSATNIASRLSLDSLGSPLIVQADTECPQTGALSWTGSPSDVYLMLAGTRSLILADVVATGSIALAAVNWSHFSAASPIGVLAAVASGVPPSFPGPGLLGFPPLPFVRSTYFSSVSALISEPETLYFDPTGHQTAAPIVTNVESEVMAYFARHPEELYQTSPRNFERIIARILKDLGFDIELTKATRDGGTDVIAHIRNAVCSLLILVECKRYSPDNRVGVDVVRSVTGVREIRRANKCLIVTTSSFTKNAIEEARRVEHFLELKDYVDLKAWLARYS